MCAEYVFWGLLWWAVGAAIFLRTCWEIIPSLSIADFLVAAVAGIFGPLTVFCWLAYTGNNFLHKRRF